MTTAALLTSFLRGAGGTVEVAVARRDAGYGFTSDAAADFARRGCQLVITGDCGTSDLEAALSDELASQAEQTAPASAQRDRSVQDEQVDDAVAASRWATAFSP